MTFRFLLLALSFAFSGQARALEIPPPPEYYVTDQAGLLNPATKVQLEESLGAFERDTSNQVLVATFPNLGGDTIEDFGIRLSERWRPGQSGRNNGAILIVSKDDRKVRIEVGYGLEGALPDAVSRTILQNEVLPRFKQGDFNGGIQAGVDAIVKATRGEYQGLARSQGTTLGGIIFLIVLIVMVIVILNAIRPYGMYRNGSYRGGAWGGGGWGGGYGGGGGGGGWGSSSGGGFRGGGGSFGGGGASGGW